MARFGRIVKFDIDGPCTIDSLRLGLKLAGLGEDKAKDMLPRHAWARACKELKAGRIISVVKEEGNFIYFQFTEEALAGDRLQYSFQAVMELNKITGDVTSGDDPALALKAKSLVLAALPVRTKADITRLIHRIFREQKGDLASWDGGGSYFVFQEHEHIVDAIEVLLNTIGGSVSSLKISVDGSDPKTQKSLAATMTDHLNGLVEEFKESCLTFSTDTDAEVLERRSDMLEVLRGKIELYADVLAEQAETMREAVQEADREMRARVMGELVSSPAVGSPEPTVEYGDTDLAALLERYKS